MNKEKLEFHVKGMLEEGLGLDLSNPNLIDTPRRIASMYTDEFFRNVGKEFDDFAEFPCSKENYDEMILFDNISFTSVCAHHLLPFTGLAWVVYIPRDNGLIGASKPSRIIEHYSARPQLQEILTYDILGCIVKGYSPRGVMVYLKGNHGCMQCRGIKQQGAGMGTSALYGCMTMAHVKAEALQLIQMSMRG